ncbi:MAG: hypothetical protein CMM15_10125 [Rhodospirillaceae bacterium]|nr:hypothetical protein [Rhodospirillaceae bacterium]OUU21863.1 MAG: hypothetical protein CBB97_15770 [Candidatus Endolissoclinum sp. TMED37]|tara:strand:+ start:1059 stop:1889 length:831 start_codon:yes stop_codon:yes gene_type:complete
MIKNIIKKSFLNRFDDHADLQIYNIWLARYELIKKSGRQPFIPDMPEKYFSQNDEDGYTLKINERFKGSLESFVEIGVGNGLENNTLLLKANGLRGLWVDAEMLPKDIVLDEKSKNFKFVKMFVTYKNINEILTMHLDKLKLKEFDVLSVDIDSDDLKVIDSITSKFRPKLIIAEINSKLGPIAHWSFSSVTVNTPAGDNFGVSYMSLKKTLAAKRYRYLAMNAGTGLNAFFIDDAYSKLFPELDLDINFVPPLYRWPKRMFGFSSYALVNSILNG